VRFGRSLTSRIGLEVSFDLMGSVAVNSTATEALELTRSSFETVFNERLSGLSNRSVSSPPRSPVKDFSGRRVAR
jgi:hypothetical protein